MDWSDDPQRPGWQRRYAYLYVWCPWCRTGHVHGWDPAHNAGHIEHREAHCADGSPMLEEGYLVSVYRQSDAESAGHCVKPGTPILRPTPEAVLRRKAATAKPKTTAPQPKPARRESSSHGKHRLPDWTRRKTKTSQ